jgi:polyvinyl alcohol dehydrogenase (cytochrome)
MPHDLAGRAQPGRLAFLGLFWFTSLFGPASARAAPPSGEAIYAKHCATCHNRPGATRAPARSVLGNLTVERILAVLDTGTMKAQASALSATERKVLAAFLSSKHGSADAPPAATMGQCPPGTPFSVPADDKQWSGWGADPRNSRSQLAQAAGLSAGDLPRLKLKWAFGFPDDLHAMSQPSIAGGRVFVGSESGAVYALDASTGCTYWSFKADGTVRTATSIGTMSFASPVIEQPPTVRTFVFFGDQNGYVYALDAGTGALRWKVRADAHEAEIITGAPKYHDGRLYVPVSSYEEGAGADPRYACCTFRGSVVALDAFTGHAIWQTYLVEEPKEIGVNKRGVKMFGPSGVAVWSSPIVDVERKAVYVATGDNYSRPPSSMSDAAVGLDLQTGRILWHQQLRPGDIWNLACVGTDKTNCPEDAGPDYDFGATPVLATVTSTRHQVIVMGQKSSEVYALDPDHDGAIVWRKKLGTGGLLGGIQWGFAADDRSVYFPLSDVVIIDEPGKPARLEPTRGGGLFALDLASGAERWHAPPSECGSRPQCSPAQSQATTVIPGAVFSGAMDGVMRAFSTDDGRLLWSFDTVRDYQSVNGVVARGGTLDASGPVVAGGTLLVTSGYPRMGGLPGNVLLAFTVDGR